MTSIFSALFGFLVAAMLGRRIWKIDDETADKLWVAYFGKGQGEQYANTRFSYWVFLLSALSFLLLGVVFSFGYFHVFCLVVSCLLATFYWQRLRKLKNREEVNEQPN